MKINHIDIEKDLGRLLLGVEKPGRYTGGEYGRLAKGNAGFQTAIAFPDLYEIGMSNQALRILYNALNGLAGVSCDRVFAPAPDFEALLKQQGIPLYGLDTGIPLGNLDLLLFTLGYELGITSVLSIMDAAGIPIHASERREGEPIVIMGGPSVSNPLPYAPFIDAFWIGEAEAGFFELVEELRDRKKAGKSRAELLTHIAGHPSVWVKGKARAVRAIDTHFADSPTAAAVFPVPTMKVVQHHGAVEIMRGCPNGCRFCHAGFWYRPMRQKSAAHIRDEAEAFIKQGGYREISLSSLSSGDYSHIDALVESLNTDFGSRHISFQLPSLKVSTFSLPLLEKISEVRKSGLTFAVETPVDAWQRSINKMVSCDDVAAILQTAKKNGWRGAKFYFMIGLPVCSLDQSGRTEEAEIVDFILDLARRTGMHFNINVGVFVPKPHTPYQWAAQIDLEGAQKKLDFIKGQLRPKGHKVSLADPFTALLEGIISRGDEGAAALIEEAWQRGCRLDAWSDYIKKDIWKELLKTYQELGRTILNPQDQTLALPWHFVDSGLVPAYLKNEYGRSKSEEFTLPCIDNCTHNCGICHNNTKIVQNIIQDKKSHDGNIDKNAAEIIKTALPAEKTPVASVKGVTNQDFHSDGPTFRIVFSFRKQGTAVFHGHLTLIEVFSMAFLRAGIPVLFSQGFNPLPKLEIVAPLSLGIYAEGEIAAIDIEGFFEAPRFKALMNQILPEGIEIGEAENFFIPPGGKKHSLSSLLWGFAYAASGVGTAADTIVGLGDAAGPADLVKAKEEKSYRQSRLGSLINPPVSQGELSASSEELSRQAIYGLKRLAVLAKNPLIKDTDDRPGESYFNVYRELYPKS
ncbi:B12-binding protein [Spirochaetia bacterium]|nr:B12-binding protein [Spirochaetia bacterium]